ncbi:Crp/Fnr family transcriptional regulator [Methylobacterium aerolatum]|uniref:DNA-binding MarR family transcriptional regulator n=1 Tax=Methylobacterium aerolatum TaxID=418708 RepID=A0ABU0I179_9HYPH|nr:helix-turn-helix domain-containing protein [Methylobacterium aerolatum]MDQ0447434.1 DNA-binding MarR family transcriptional regulator [Methylobacterium aerolatum]GJD34185.1 hypothetical protein FMGBMHLM_1081 [Methylobacterium aerolatum]
MQADIASKPDDNLLLKSLSVTDRELIVPHLQPVTFAKAESIFTVGSPVTQVTFPCRHTVVTLMVATRDGRSAETATVGHEGAVGGVVNQGYLPASTSAIVQIGGPALRIEAALLREARRRSPQICDLMIRYSDCLLAQVLQSSACNSLHPIDQRCLRWLLTLRDRIGSPSLPVTHELLAGMLGVQRTYLTRILRNLQNQGLITVGRGRITVSDVGRMERAACECHGRVRDHFETVLGAVYSDDGLERIERRETDAVPAPSESLGRR